MVFNTLSVGAAVTPAVIETAISHYLNRKPLHQKPTAHISYHEGLSLVRQFLDYAAHHTVDDLQAFTGQWVPTPHWVKAEVVTIPTPLMNKSADLLREQLGHSGIDKIGGKTWWQWRQEDAPLKAEWIEMRQDYHERKAAGNTRGDRIMLYVHGGAYFFGSVDEHRYQMQRHARKLKARVLAPRYRLAPQFPFPCGLYDCLAAYLYLLEEHDPSTILLAGDSAGGGMVLSMLVILRDQGVPLPAGAILLSPWVDLTHSFPSVAGDDSFDYIPSNGFHQRPSMSWPPPTSNDMKDIAKGAVQKLVDAEKKGLHSTGKVRDEKQKQHKEKEEQEEQEAIQGFVVDYHPGDRDEIANDDNPASPANPDTRGGDTIPGPGHNLSMMLDGKLVEIIDQIQMYTTNQLLAHPLVSPVLQPSLGGLPPLLIQTGGGELLRDEQIYVAHKAANPQAYPASETIRDEYDPHGEVLRKYPPTSVQLQVWEDLCHVPHTLSFTRPAKYMYRGVAQFGAWAYSNAQQKANSQLEDDDAQSTISTESESSTAASSRTDLKSTENEGGPRPKSRDPPVTTHWTGTMDTEKPVGASSGSVGRAGDPIPPFHNHMIRQRVTRHGIIYPLAPPAEIPSLQLDVSSIGVIKAGPVRKWLARKTEWDNKFKREKRNVQKQRVKEIAQGYDVIGNEETPPPTALAGRRRKDMPKAKHRAGKSWGLAIWSGWGSKHDETTIDKDKDGGRRRNSSSKSKNAATDKKRERQVSGSAAKETIQTQGDDREHDTTGTSQTISGPDTTKDTAVFGTATAGTAAAGAAAIAAEHDDKETTSHDVPPTSSPSSTDPDQANPMGTSDKVPGSENTFLSPTSSRPHNGTVAYPFTIRNEHRDRNASTFTLDSGHEIPAMDATRIDDDQSAAGGVAHLGSSGGTTRAADDDVGRGLDGDIGNTDSGGGDSDEQEARDEGMSTSRPQLQTFITAREF